MAEDEQKERIRKDLLGLYFDERARDDRGEFNLLIQILKNLFNRSMLSEVKLKTIDDNKRIRARGERLLDELIDCLT